MYPRIKQKKNVLFSNRIKIIFLYENNNEFFKLIINAKVLSCSVFFFFL